MDPIGLVTSKIRLHSLEISERTFVLDMSFKCDGDELPSDDTLEALINECHPRDDIRLSLTKITDETISFTKSDLPVDNTEEFREGLDSDDELSVNLRIDKKMENNRLSIYQLDCFLDWLLDKTTWDLMSEFGHLLTNKKLVVLDLLNDDSLVATRSIVFAAEKKLPYETSFDRLGRLDLCRQVARFHSTMAFDLLPDDFHIVNCHTKTKITDIFAKLETLLSMIYIASSSYLDNEELKVQIDGQRNASFCYSIGPDLIANEELFRIYDWIYTGGNPVDKAIIARNVISLHCKYVDLIRTTEDTYASIQSNFALYQRDNVYKYLELKNKLAEFIISSVSQFGDAMLDLSEKMRGNMIAFFAFIITAFLGNLGSSSPVPLTGIFTKDVTWLSYLILSGSVGYMLISRQEMNLQIRRIRAGYDNLKDSYKELLDKKDLDEMFGQDKVIESNTREAMKHQDMICGIWFSLLIAAFLVIDLLSSSPILK